MINAINELKKFNYDLNIVKQYQKSDQTYLKDNTLYYKNIPEGLMLLVNKVNNNDIKINSSLTNFGTMIDVSRGAVFNINYVKDLIRKKALMGVNELWIYMEDIYELDKYPSFGYQRGRYSKEELKEIIDYANIFGIRIVPAIQTLGHMEQFLRWFGNRPMMDQNNCLLTRSDETFELIFEMLKFFKENFSITKIHLGLDETWGFGFGLFYKKNGYVEPMKLFLEHLNKVNDMALQLGYEEVLIWSDMFFRFLSETNNYYDPNIILTEEVINNIPKNITLVYWDYYNKDKKLVSKMVENHINTNRKVIFASGTWIWTKFNYDKKQTDETALMHLEVALENNLEDYILTQWLDDGAFGDHESTLLGVYELSVKAKTYNKINKEVFEYITKMDYNKQITKSRINQTTISQVGLLWDDPLYSVYLNNHTNNDVKLIENNINELIELKKLFENDSYYEFEYNIVMSNLYKLQARVKMLTNYFNKTKINIEEEYNNQIKHLKFLNNYFSNLWYTKYKPNGFEAIQSRIATQIYRAKEMIKFINLYNEGKIKQINAFDEKVGVYKQYVPEKHSYVAFTMKPF